MPRGQLSAESLKKRGDAIRAALARRTPEQIAAHHSKIGAAHKKGISEGRIKPSIEKAIRAAAKANKGRKRPKEIVDKCAAANRGKKRTEEVKRKFSERSKALWASGKVYTPEVIAIKNRRAVATRKARGYTHSPEWREAHSRCMTGRKPNPEDIAARATAMRDRPQTAEATKKGVNHVGARTAPLRSSANVVYSFRNLLHFVREHPELFFPEDVVWYRPFYSGKLRGPTCNAAKGLGRLLSKNKSPGAATSWKGWTVVGDVERDINNTKDLLDRDVVEVRP